MDTTPSIIGNRVSIVMTVTISRVFIGFVAVFCLKTNQTAPACIQPGGQWAGVLAWSSRLSWSLAQCVHFLVPALFPQPQCVHFLVPALFPLPQCVHLLVPALFPLPQCVHLIVPALFLRTPMRTFAGSGPLPPTRMRTFACCGPIPPTRMRTFACSAFYNGFSPTTSLEMYWNYLQHL
jgi:hypothetical protein